MSLTLGRIGSNWVMQDGKFVNCACCGTHASDCNASRIPTDLRLTVRYMLDGVHPKYLQAVVLTYNATACSGGTPGWAYAGGDVTICSGFSFRALSLCCISSAWKIELVVVNNGIQDDLQNPGSLANPTTVASSPLHMTSISNGEYSTPCGLGFIYIDIEEIAAVSPCCATDMPSTATATFTIDGLAPQTLNLTRGTNNNYGGNRTCVVGDGHTVVLFDLNINCLSITGNWSADFTVSKIVDGVQVSLIDWAISAKFAGVIYSDFQATCDPYHMHFEGLNTGGSTGGGASQICGGVTYPFATAGNINLVLDIVTP